MSDISSNPASAGSDPKPWKLRRWPHGVNFHADSTLASTLVPTRRLHWGPAPHDAAAFEDKTMKTTDPQRGLSAFAGLAAAFACSGVWLGFGLFIFAIQGGGAA